MATFRILNFGCRASQADGAALKAQLVAAGFTDAGGSGSPDLAILNTCTVTAAADAEVRQIIRHIHREDPGCRVLITGCYAQRAPEEIAALPGVAWVVGNSHKHLIAQILKGERNREQNREKPWVGKISTQFHFLPVASDDRTRPTLKIQDGCNARCSFCIIPTVRGRSRSLPSEDVVAQIRRLEEKGYREVVISGINLGSYGLDLQPRISFSNLLEKILEQTSLPRLRISSIEPMDVRPELIRLVASEPRMAQHFHIPLQSGCDRILRQMNRRYWTAHYAERITAIRAAMPNCGIGADVMVGFPGETDQDHAVSAQFIDSLPFTYLHIFPYSARPSTPAASRADQVNGRIAHARGADLRALIARKRHEFMTLQLGLVLSALTLGQGQNAETEALSSNYLSLRLPECRLPPNQLINVRIGRVHEGKLVGHLD
jgi:threonylcarbamoyladenosine tRNA methylthiotransferase MtaB